MYSTIKLTASCLTEQGLGYQQGVLRVVAQHAPPEDQAMAPRAPAQGNDGAATQPLRRQAQCVTGRCSQE